MLRIALNSEVLAAALCSATGASHALLNAAAYRRLSLLVTAPLMAEYRETLLSPVQRLAHGRAEEAMERFLKAIATVAESVATDLHWLPRQADPVDELVLQTAVMGRADALVTLRPARFRAARAFALRVLTPAELLRSMR
jgi:putative PIN family toxin of toxin-antitoxin system